MRPLEFGWYLPTHGDTTAYGVMEAQVAGSPELCDRVVQAAEAAGFEYLLIPVGSTCWEAWISGAFMAARSARIKPLIAARPGYINPVLLAKMISTFDQMSGGRICVNLIAGQNESEVEGEGVRYAKEERYALMEEEVSILKALWTTRGPLNFAGKFHTLSGAHIRPRPLQQPFPKFYSVAARVRPGKCRQNIPTCICSGAICRNGLLITSPRSGKWRKRTAATTTSDSACGCR
jgi:alkanesulfonate monooxygenase